jgi:hypothetical protein
LPLLVKEPVLTLRTWTLNQNAGKLTEL